MDLIFLIALMNTSSIFSTDHPLTQSVLAINDLTQLQQWQHNALPEIIDVVLTAAALPEPLNAACRYAMYNGGKRVRPLLVLASFLTVCSRALDADRLAMVYRAMAAVELIHGYSLVHDDLPCMDDDALRRGQPTCHVVYGEAVALLTGDALLSIAFEALGGEYHDHSVTCDISLRLSQTLAPRARRMVSGQMLDIQAEGQSIDQASLEAIHRDKTGALIEAAVLMGGICAGADTDQLRRLASYAQQVGLAFQVQDDVLDVIADTATLGKPAGSDEKLEKSTYVKLLGIDAAQQYAADLFDDARAQVADFGDDNLLIQIIDWLQQRQF